MDLGFGAASLSGDLGAAIENIRTLTSGFTQELGEATKAMRSFEGQSQRLSRSMSSSLRSAFDKAVFSGEQLGDVFRDLASSIAGQALNAALKPVTDGVAGAATGLIGTLSSGLFSALGFAQGGVFSAGRVTPFAKGGIVGGPTLFPMRGGAGLMGEAGPEAIMPLSRGPDGKLGVRAQAGGTPSVVVNITTPDVDGFQRSRSQVSAQLARAVRRGQGNL